MNMFSFIFAVTQFCLVQSDNEFGQFTEFQERFEKHYSPEEVDM